MKPRCQPVTITTWHGNGAANLVSSAIIARSMSTEFSKVNTMASKYLELGGMFKELQQRLSTLEATAPNRACINDLFADVKYPKPELEKYLKNAQEEDIDEDKRQRKNLHYLAILKSCSRLYASFNDKLFGEMKMLERQLLLGKTYLEQNVISKADFEQFDSKIRVYDNKIMKLEKHNPWLKDPSFSLPHIQAQALKLNYLRDAKSDLLRQLDLYKGMKPSMDAARICLQQAKSNYRKVIDADN